MSSISILPCTAADGPAIGALNVHAFWTDRTWVRLWPGKTRDYVASQAARRGTHMLLSDRRRRRHLKAVDPADDNRIVGYARWEMPLSLPADREEGRDRLGHSLWPQARVPDVSDNDRQRAQEESEAADWEFDRSLDVLDPPMIDMKDEQMRHKHYICRLVRFRIRDAQMPTDQCWTTSPSTPTTGAVASPCRWCRRA